MTQGVKRIVRSLITTGPLPNLFRPFLRGRATVFMLHRFRDPELGVEGHDPLFLERALTHLTRAGFRIVPLLELIERAKQGDDVSATIAFTVDDGHSDFHRVAAPIFHRHRCPVTVFLPTNFLDQGTWLWPDRVRFAMHHTRETQAVIVQEHQVRTLRWSNEMEKSEAWRAATWSLVGLGDEARTKALGELERQLLVQVPEVPPAQYRSITWEQVRENGRRGVTFGPHSVTHPNMGHLDSDGLRAEIAGSWERIRSETDAAIPVFCYPFGESSHCPPHAEPILRASGIEAAVTGLPGHVGAQEAITCPFLLPRFPWPDDMPDFRQIIYGIEQVKAALRSRRGPHPRHVPSGT